MVALLEPARRAAGVGGAKRSRLAVHSGHLERGGAALGGQASLDPPEAAKSGDRRFAAKEWHDTRCTLENQRPRHQKTDCLDARALLDRLESYLNGSRHAMSIVAVPSIEEEQQRSVVRYR